MDVRVMRRVLPVLYEEVTAWFTEKHYARRVPSISFCFGLYEGSVLEGVVSYGTPPSSTLLAGVCGEEHAGKVIELNRLVLNEGLPKNSASYLVGRSLRLLPKPKIVVSFADTGQGHVGYVYQACNFIYTGLTAKFVDPKIRGQEGKHHTSYGHSLTYDELREKFGDDLYFEERARKHRYVYFVGCPELKAALKYSIQPYPKGDSRRYDSGKALPTQRILF